MYCSSGSVRDGLAMALKARSVRIGEINPAQEAPVALNEPPEWGAGGSNMAAWRCPVIWCIVGGCSDSTRFGLWGGRGSVRGKEDLWMRGPDRPGGRAEQCGGERLSLEKGGVRRWAGAVVCAVCERASDGGGNRCQVSGKDLSRQRATLRLLS